MEVKEDLQSEASQTLAEKFAKMEEAAILELLNVAQVPLTKDGTLVDALGERGFKIYGIESITYTHNYLKSTWVLEHCGKIVTQRDVMLNLK